MKMYRSDIKMLQRMYRYTMFCLFLHASSGFCLQTLRGKEDRRRQKKTEEDRRRQKKTEEDRRRQKKTEEDRRRQKKT
jgi:uncharacterized protein YlxW (UPF0749 family)